MHGIFISFTYTTAGVAYCGLGTQHATHREHGLHEPPEMAWCVRHHILLKVTTKLCMDQNVRISNTYFKLHPRINTATERAISLFVSPWRMSASQIFPKASAYYVIMPPLPFSETRTCCVLLLDGYDLLIGSGAQNLNQNVLCCSNSLKWFRVVIQSVDSIK